MEKKINYRKEYEKICNIKLSSDYEVHHIDFNRKNNDISNLVALPKQLHIKYHTSLKKYENLQYKIQTKLIGSLEPGLAINRYIENVDIEIMKEFIDVWYECQKYVLYRDQLLGIIP